MSFRDPASPQWERCAIRVSFAGGRDDERARAFARALLADMNALYDRTLAIKTPDVPLPPGATTDTWYCTSAPGIESVCVETIDPASTHSYCADLAALGYRTDATLEDSTEGVTEIVCNLGNGVWYVFVQMLDGGLTTVSVFTQQDYIELVKSGG